MKTEAVNQHIEITPGMCGGKPRGLVVIHAVLDADEMTGRVEYL